MEPQPRIAQPNSPPLSAQQSIRLFLHGHPWHPVCYRHDRTVCMCCSVDIEKGHTAWQSPHFQGEGAYVCRDCGINWHIYTGALHVQEIDRIPPYGGPVILSMR